MTSLAHAQTMAAYNRWMNERLYHQTHHRGQLTTLLKQTGRDPGVTDLVWLPGLGAVSEARGA